MTGWSGDKLPNRLTLTSIRDGLKGTRKPVARERQVLSNIEQCYYCSDVMNTYRLWLRRELFRGRLDQSQFELSERKVVRFVGPAER